MLFSTRSERRPYHLGTYPLETLPRDDSIVESEAGRPRTAAPRYASQPTGPLAASLREYLAIFVANAAAAPASRKAPIPDDPHRRMMDVKGYSYFMNASQVGICRMPPNAWAQGEQPLEHSYAIALILEHGRVPEQGNPAREWIEPAVVEAAD